MKNYWRPTAFLPTAYICLAVAMLHDGPLSLVWMLLGTVWLFLEWRHEG